MDIGEVRTPVVPSCFSYLMEKRAAIAPEELETLAKIAAKRYVDEKIPLNATIQKLAEERELNRNQVERVCEMANLATHQALWPRAAEKEKLAFELADPKKLKSKNTERHHGSSIEADYCGPPRGIPGSGPSLASLLGVTPDAGHQGLAGPSDKQRILIVLQKKAAERKRLRDQLLCAGMAAETAEKRAYAAVKQEVLGGTPMRDVLGAAAAAGLGKLACELLPRFQQQLVDEAQGSTRTGLEKNAISRAPEDLISDELGAITVVNGAHPVLVSLDTVQKQNGVVKNLLYGLLKIDDELKVYHQQLRELG
jgi:hypothetical protein